MRVRQGTVKAFDGGPYTATVQLQGSVAIWLRDVPVARNIASGEVTAGRKCAVLLFDEANPQDAVVMAVWV